jgi:hypothetical protein
MVPNYKLAKLRQVNAGSAFLQNNPSPRKSVSRELTDIWLCDKPLLRIQKKFTRLGFDAKKISDGFRLHL